MLAYSYKTHVGLITFATTPNITMGISHVIENFRRAVGDMEATGDTALWDALALAKDQLVEYSGKHPEAKKRIICISDGMDTKSTTNRAPEICWRLHEAGIVVDSVSLGNQQNSDLSALSHLLVSLHNLYVCHDNTC
jgi:Mg-chelatase subunit ChlD